MATENETASGITVREKIEINRTSTDKYSYTTTLDITRVVGIEEAIAVAEQRLGDPAVSLVNRFREASLRDLGIAVKQEIEVRKMIGGGEAS